MTSCPHCEKATLKIRKMSLSYLNSLVRKSTSVHNDFHEDDDENESEEKLEEGNRKPGFLSTLKRRWQLRMGCMHSKARSRLRNSPSGSECDSGMPRGRSSRTQSDCEHDNYVEPKVERAGPSSDADSSSPLAPNNCSLSEKLQNLSNYGWYWGPIPREIAEETLLNQPDGAFLVRDSSSDHFLLTVSFRCSGRTLHSRIFYTGGLFSLYSSTESEGFPSIPELIEHSVVHSKTTVFCYSRPRSPGHPAFPVRLTHAVSRRTQVRSLMYLCRFVIRQNVSVDRIKDLPIPKTLIEYVLESQF